MGGPPGAGGDKDKKEVRGRVPTLCLYFLFLALFVTVAANVCRACFLLTCVGGQEEAQVRAASTQPCWQEKEGVL